MAVLKLRYVESFKDRHGHIRYYFRRRKGKRVPLPGAPGSPEFMAAYGAALKSGGEITGTAAHPRSFGALVSQYFRSPNFLRLKPSSQYCTRNTMERFVAEHGNGLVPEMTRAHVEQIIGAKAETPAAANTTLKRLRTLINYSIALGWRQTDPTKGVPKFQEGEYHTWTDAELAAFEARWPLGTLQRTAYALALYTGQRRADLCVMPPPSLTDGLIPVKQEKTGTDLLIPVHPDLALALKSWKGASPLVVLNNTYGRPYTVESFGNLMAAAIKEAGLPKRCVLHGLRKAAARRLAEAGCTAHQIQAITGHKSLEEVERYTRAASQTRMAGDAISKLSSRRVGERRNTPKKSVGRAKKVGRRNH